MFEKIKQVFARSQPKQGTQTAALPEAVDLSVTEREKHIYGEDRVNRLRLYEKWACKDTWILKTEGIALLCGVDPENSNFDDQELKKQLDELWQHASDCVRKKLLTVVNPVAPEDQWEVIPADIYCWATVSRIDVPQELVSLMEFVLQTVKIKPIQRPAEISTNNGDVDADALYQRHREIILGAALSLLANQPEQCKTSRGRIKSRLIADQIMKHTDFWFGKDEPALAQSAMEDLIDLYIAESNNLVTLSGN